MTKSVLQQYITEQGLIVEGDESVDELQEAYHFLRNAGRPTIIKEEAKQ